MVQICLRFSEFYILQSEVTVTLVDFSVSLKTKINSQTGDVESLLLGPLGAAFKKGWEELMWLAITGAHPNSP